jgi:CRISPR-associated protein Cas1
MDDNSQAPFDLTLDRLEAAWVHVRDNAGCAGVDGVTIESFEYQAPSALPELLKQASEGDYLALPLRKIVVTKNPGSSNTRTLLVPVVRDRILQTAVASRMSNSFEEEFFDASFGYRPHRGVDRAIARIVQLRDRGFGWVVDADIRAYFDSVSHQSLLRQLGQNQAAFPFLSLLKQWIGAVCWDGHDLTLVRRGIPQGAPISPVLANLFLTPIDQALEESDSHLIRYADDFLLLCKSEAAAERACRDAANLFTQHGLELSQEKTRITSFSQGFTFLGVTFRGNDVFTPWKDRQPHGKLIFMARPMPERILRNYRKDAKPPAPAQPEQTAAPTPAPNHQPIRGDQDLPFLYIADQGAILRKSGDRFLVEADQTIRLDVPYHRLENILLFGNIQVTTQALAEALDKGISFTFLTRQGRLRGSLVPPGDHNVGLRISQYQTYLDEERSLKIARSLIDAKVRNAISVLRRYEERGKASAEAERGVMTRALDSLPAAASRAEVDGLEGISAKNYFDAVMRFNESPFSWPGRIKHPATDPLNALLSLTYTLLMNELAALIQARGLDPAIGMLHELDPSRPSLALDLMEPFRAPLADRFVLTSVNRSVFQPADFAPGDDHGSVILHPAAMHRFFEQYEHWMQEGIGPEGEPPVSFRMCLRREVESLCRSLHGEAELAPFTFPIDAPPLPGSPAPQVQP